MVVESAFKRGSEDVVAIGGSNQIRGIDVLTLKPGEWLNDQVSIYFNPLPLDVLLLCKVHFK